MLPPGGVRTTADTVYRRISPYIAARHHIISCIIMAQQKYICKAVDPADSSTRLPANANSSLPSGNRLRPA